MCFVFISEETATCATYSINLLYTNLSVKGVLLTERFVYKLLKTHRDEQLQKKNKLIGFYNRDEKCLQRGTDWVVK
jgi:hypothetical protein